jgi:hypothetical protein
MRHRIGDDGEARRQPGNFNAHPADPPAIDSIFNVLQRG